MDSEGGACSRRSADQAPVREKSWLVTSSVQQRNRWRSEIAYASFCMGSDSASLGTEDCRRALGARGMW